jgi:anionic cell wall polymer biosynthesis LytR-Cps2A-Psr (LCP) family protein
MGKAIAGKVLYGLLCVAAVALLVVSGYAHRVVGLTTELGKGIAISNSPAVGAMNILVMGLESRTNYQGQTLPNSLLTAMHAGSASSVDAGELGSQDTNTLILIHIFAGGRKAVGFSIPRDDLVTYPRAYDGQAEGKIDGAYAYAYTQSLQSTVSSSMSEPQRYLEANKAGQAATVATVSRVTGQHIDHFVEVNLAGFYYLAQAFGGIEVCIMPAPAQNGFPAGANLTDKDTLVDPPTDNSGFDAFLNGYDKAKGGAQYLHLKAPQALAFVRSRDTLPGVDLGRTKRQQATIDYVIYQLKHEGVLSSVSKLNTLLSSASQYLITDSTFDLLDFASDMTALNGQDLSFTTLPYTPQNNVQVPGYPGLQDVNIIDVPAIQRLVRTAFSTGSVPSGTGTPGAGTPSTGTTGGDSTTATAAASLQALSAQVIGARPAASPSARPAPSSTSQTGSSGTGGTLKVAPNARYGIPCVY